MPATLHPLIAPLQQLLCTSSHAPEKILYLSDTSSTNDDALQLYQQGYRRAWVISEQQSHGRGQHGKQWLSERGNIFFSVLSPLQRTIDGRLALECGLNLIHVPCLSQLPLQLKWANDLYSPNGKWGGILIEPINPTQCIVGVGINIFAIQQCLAQPQPTTALTQLGFNLTDTPMTVLLSQLYQAVIQAIDWFNHDSPRLAQRFNAVTAFKQQWVQVIRPNETLLGYFQGIQNDGAMLIQPQLHCPPIACYDGQLRPIE